MVQTTERLISTDAQRFLLIYMIVVLVVITTLVITFFIVFQKRKNKLLLDKIKQKQVYEEEISKTQTEIQEQTLKNIGWELHDNVGQLLAVASMQLNLLSTLVSGEIKEKVNDATDVIRNSLKEIRSLSKTLNNEVILNNGFEKSIINELDRLKRMKFASAELHAKGDKVELKNKKHEIIIFRILQEFFSNSVKYSEAKNLKIILHYSPEKLKIEASDDGKGFDINKIEKGSGLITMKSRAALIKAELDIESKPKQGVTLKLEYQF